MDTLEKITALVLQVTGSLSSWSTIITNIISVLLTFSCRNIIRSFYATLDTMNDFVTNFIFVLLALSLYGIIFKAVSFSLSLGKHFLQLRHSKKLKIQHTELIKQKLLTLSKHEIAILKFILQQPAFSAWLPDNYNTTIFLLKKELITRFSSNTKTISTDPELFSEALSFASLFTVPENVRDILADMPPELAARWRNTRVNNSFAKYQH